MRRLLGGRALAAAWIATIALLAAGGGYSIAGSSSGSSGTIGVCVSKSTGALYRGKCHKHDGGLRLLATGSTGASGAPAPAKILCPEDQFFYGFLADGSQACDYPVVADSFNTNNGTRASGLLPTNTEAPVATTAPVELGGSYLILGSVTLVNNSSNSLDAICDLRSLGPGGVDIGEITRGIQRAQAHSYVNIALTGYDVAVKPGTSFAIQCEGANGTPTAGTGLGVPPAAIAGQNVTAIAISKTLSSLG
jgi:hypothetical protein